MLQLILLAATFALALCSGCATPPQQSADVEYYAPKVYRTGSNLPVKDYSADNVDVLNPDVINPAYRINHPRVVGY